MLTGEQLAIGKETAKQLGMGTNILDAEGFDDRRGNESEKLEQCLVSD